MSRSSMNAATDHIVGSPALGVWRKNRGMFQRFLIIGGLGFGVDAVLTLGLMHVGVAAHFARVVAIAVAMAFTWLCNRRFTFAVDQDASVAEGMRYAAVALLAALLNYGVFLALLNVGVPPFVALVMATALQTAFSYWAYRRFVFGARALP
jgi:putative flippase GtrA